MALNQLFSFESFKLILFSIVFYFTYVNLLKPILNFIRLALYYRSFPTTKNHWLFGHFNQIWVNFPFPHNLESIQRNFHEIFDKIVSQNRDQPTVVLWHGLLPLVNIANHEGVEILLNKMNLKKPYFHKFIDLGDGLVTSEPDLWKVRRKMIQPFFSTKKLKAQVETMNAEVESFCSKLNKLIGKPVDLEHQIHFSTLNIILKSTLSIPLDDSIEIKQELLKLINVIEKNSIKRVVNPFYYPDWIFNLTEFGRFCNKANGSIFKYMYELIKRRSVLLSSQSVDPEDQDFYALLENRIDEKGFKDELKTIIGAGHDTTAVGLRWILFNLGNHQEVQERLFQEIIRFFPDDTPVDDVDKIRECEYLHQCVKESLRLNPPISGVPRTLEEDIMIKDKKLIKGTLVTVMFESIHRDPSIYPEPDKYDPDRWSPENAIKIPKTAFIPFGYGPRSCIGYRYAFIELKIYIIHVIRKFILRSVRKHGSIPVKFDITTKPMYPLEIIMTPRNNN